MRLKLSLKTKTKKGKKSEIKFNIAPSKHIGFINFVNLALAQNKEVTISIEKTLDTGDKEEVEISGDFKFEKK